ncbi:hypothetical protein B0O80DRAFT_459562 [Mortierella sp. GBAus27b]|nr:hypothetical protein B0O80DRAFT_459562 [Mortierella sp. GBAus27b]
MAHTPSPSPHLFSVPLFRPSHCALCTVSGSRGPPLPLCLVVTFLTVFWTLS